MGGSLAIIIPAFNAEKYLNDSVASVLRQLRPGDTIVIVDDASTDRTRLLAGQLSGANPNVIALVAGGGKGVSEARNVGVLASQSDYVAFLDADDIYLPGALELLRALLDTNADADIAMGLYTHELDTELPERYEVEFLPARSLLADTLYRRPGRHESASAKIYRRRLLEGISPLFVPGRRYEDLEAMARIYLKARAVAFADVAVYGYRRHEGSFMRQWTPARADALWAADTICSTVGAASDAALMAAAVSRRFSACFNILAFALRAGDKCTADRCLAGIADCRAIVVADRHAPLRNRLAAAMSYSGRFVTALMARVYGLMMR